MCRRSSSERSFWKAGIGLSPVVIFQWRVPSLWAAICDDDRSLGLRFISLARVPSPLPAGPWHTRQLLLYRALPRATDLGSAGTGFLFWASALGTVQFADWSAARPNEMRPVIMIGTAVASIEYNCRISLAPSLWRQFPKAKHGAVGGAKFASGLVYRRGPAQIM